MKTTAGLIGRIIKFTTGMKRGKDQTLGTDALFMHSNGDASAIV